MKKSSTTKPGRISFDDRGNAVFEWTDTALTEEGELADYQRVGALAPEDLTLADESGVRDTVNRQGPKLGYNPYQSGMLAADRSKKKRDIRALSNWIQLKKKVTSAVE